MAESKPSFAEQFDALLLADGIPAYVLITQDEKGSIQVTSNIDGNSKQTEEEAIVDLLNLAIGAIEDPDQRELVRGQ